MTRHRGQGATWFKKRSVSRRLNIEASHADARDVGGQRVDIEALLAAPAENYPVDAEEFRARAHRWLTRAS